MVLSRNQALRSKKDIDIPKRTVKPSQTGTVRINWQTEITENFLAYGAISWLVYIVHNFSSQILQFYNQNPDQKKNVILASLICIVLAEEFLLRVNNILTVSRKVLSLGIIVGNGLNIMEKWCPCITIV